MLKHPTYDQLYALGLHGMAKALLEIAAAGEADGLGHHEWLGLLLDRESSWRQDKRLAGRLRVAKLRQQACVEDVDYRSPRALCQQRSDFGVNSPVLFCDHIASPSRSIGRSETVKNAGGSPNISDRTRRCVG